MPPKAGQACAGTPGPITGPARKGGAARPGASTRRPRTSLARTAGSRQHGGAAGKGSSWPRTAAGAGLRSHVEDGAMPEHQPDSARQVRTDPPQHGGRRASRRRRQHGLRGPAGRRGADSCSPSSCSLILRVRRRRPTSLLRSTLSRRKTERSIAKSTICWICWASLAYRYKTVASNIIRPRRAGSRTARRREPVYGLVRTGAHDY